MTIEDELVVAIRERRVVTVQRAGDPGTRVVHPHALLPGRHGDLLVEVFQVGGFSVSGALPGWRMLDVAEVTSVEVGEDRFEPAPGYNPRHHRYRRALSMV